MTSLDFQEPENAFLLGCLVALGKERLPATQDEEYLSSFRSRCADFLGPDLVIELASDEAPSLRVRGPEGHPLVIGARLERAFVQGVFSALVIPGVDGKGEPRLQLRQPSAPTLTHVLSVLGLSLPEMGFFEGVAALDAVGRVLDEAPCALPTMVAFFDHWRAHIALVNASSQGREAIRVQLVHPDAQAPKKEHVSDSGYDLTLLYEKKRFGKTILFGTGVIVQPPFGWYFDVVPRSSIIKQGYILANSVGVIDRSYRGEIFVPLIKIDENAPELELPARLVQLIPRPIVHFPVELKSSLTSTVRGSGGFGSTGK